MTRSEIFRNNYKYQVEQSKNEEINTNQKPKRKIGKVQFVSIFNSPEQEKLFAECANRAQEIVGDKGLDWGQYSKEDEER